MRRIRVIPILQIEKRKLVKTTMFKTPGYVGDPMNALRIFNDKEVDEIAVIDIGATRNKKEPDLEFIHQLAGECFMPLSYGGGVTTPEQASAIFQTGVEKIILGSSGFHDPSLITAISKKYGSQSVTVSVDVKSDWLGRQRVFVVSGLESTGNDPITYAKNAVQSGAGELLLQSIDREGTGKGYDLDLIAKVSSAVDVPVVSLGGAASLKDFLQAVQHGASGVAAGDMFVYKGPHKGVLINYPSQENLFNDIYNYV